VKALVSQPVGRRLGVGLLVFILLAGAGWYFLDASDTVLRSEPQASSTAGSRDRTAAGREFRVSHLARIRRASFAIFRTPPENLPKLVRRILQRAKYRVNWTLVQRLPLRIHTPVWAVQRKNLICLVNEQNQIVGTTCNSIQNALKYGISTTFLSDASTGASRTRRIIVGIAPNRTREVVAHTSGSTVRIPVVDGVFLQRDAVKNPPDRMTLVKHAPLD
jgi:hypothetical protein